MRVYFTDKVMNVIYGYMKMQDEKGLKKYGVTLDDVNMEQYDWNQMAMEELVDCIKYLVLENKKLKQKYENLKTAVNHTVSERINKER